MFYILVFTGLSFFVFGVTSTLLSSLKIQREYELITTELVRTDTSLRDLEVRYQESQNELNVFKVRIEASRGWTKEETNGMHGELEKMKTEYVRVKLNPEGRRPFDTVMVQEKCSALIRESEEYNKLLLERNDELSKLKDVFESMKRQLEENQKALAVTQEELKGLRTPEETQQKLRDVVEELEALRVKEPVLELARETEDKPVEDIVAPLQKDKDSNIGNDNSRKHLETMKSLLQSLDNNDISDGE